MKQHTGSTELIMDVACGTGQLSKHYQTYFDRLIGVDISETQIKVGSEKNVNPDKISFHVHNCHDLASFWESNEVEQEIRDAIQGKKADMLAMGQCLHWFDRDTVFKTYNESLAEDGTLSVFGYATCSIIDTDFQKDYRQFVDAPEDYFKEEIVTDLNKEKEYSEQDAQAQAAFRKFYDFIKGHFECKREHLDKYYNMYDFDSHYSVIDKFLYYDVKNDMPLKFFIQYLRSWSGYRCYLQKHPEESNPIEDLVSEFCNIYEKENEDGLEDVTVDVAYPYFLVSLKY